MTTTLPLFLGSMYISTKCTPGSESEGGELDGGDGDGVGDIEQVGVRHSSRKEANSIGQ